MTSPVRFCFGLHLHQPVGNFGFVFEEHIRDVYLPFLDIVEKEAFFPLAFHISGPLIEWMEANDSRYLDRVARLAADGKIELLLAGYYEPVLAALPRRDRQRQLRWMQEKLQARFGVTGTGLWLTERVWEPDLASDLAQAGVEYALVDDRHFLVSGFEREQLHGHYLTEHDGQRVALFPIDERLRYLIPFRPPHETVDYLKQLQRSGHTLAVLADDGEKFGGWPGTKEWVFDQGWLTQFIHAIKAARDEGVVELSTFKGAFAALPSSGIAYLSTASYREMEAWSLPTPAAERLAAFEKSLGEDIAQANGTLIRGSHWRNFMVKYAEANRMHKKMLAISEIADQRDASDEVLRALGRGQCNDAYWHGVFGGLYLPFLREAVWTQLAVAERLLRAGQPISCVRRDFDFDGQEELLITSEHCSVVIAPHRGGGIEELTRLSAAENLCNTLTRRREPYHVVAPTVEPATPDDAVAEGMASIHDIEAAVRIDELPPIDLDVRAIFLERVLGPEVTRAAYESCSYQPLRNFARERLRVECTIDYTGVSVVMRTEDARLTKTLRIFDAGHVQVTFEWDTSLAPDGAWFTTEFSLDRDRPISMPQGGELWSHSIETTAKSEKGLDKTVQGVGYLVRFPIVAGHGVVAIL